ncbi:MAG TPA: single-stranded DNA-binding protein [Candidatus Competibacteraceae bacterium]|nr:single-stranded DNA-binding protein [Candidatus Competibacteraceae bacterium]HRZ05089.1 single-stranded DNA-binding protein [Candidatus Competibacteraceae bacterium]HSA48117.1 single-stranded DNA-binding protein [Candidatus Competibacteraceae bacterium]
MIRCLITGNLFGDPQARTSQAGKPFTTAKVRADGKDGNAVWVSLVAFNELAERLAGMKANNAVAVSGKLEVSAYTAKSGEPAAGLSIIVDELATLKAKPKPNSSDGGGRR